MLQRAGDRHRDAHTVICVARLARPSQELSRPANPVRATELDRGSAGRSAQAEYDRRRHKREERIDAKFGRLAGVVKFLPDDPQSAKAWVRCKAEVGAVIDVAAVS
jgi:hypothetical protein